MLDSSSRTLLAYRGSSVPLATQEYKWVPAGAYAPGTGELFGKPE